MNAIFLIMAGASIVTNTPADGRKPFSDPLPAGPAGTVGACGIAGVEKGQVIPKEVLSRAHTSPQSLRILRTGDAATMDFRPDRLNIIVDRQGRVVDVRCG